MGELTSPAAVGGSQPGPPKRERRWLLFSAVFALLLVCFQFVLLEVGTRIVDVLGISYYPETARFFDELIIEEPIGYRMRPGMDEEFYGTRIKINSLGMRDSEIPAEKAPGEFRLLMLGDSVVFSIGVEIEDSIPRQLQAMANRNAPAGRHFRMLNAGVPSYNTEQELIQLKSFGLSLHPDAVILLFARNDIEPKTWVLDKRSGVMTNLAQRSYVMSLAFVLRRQWQRSSSKGAPPAVQVWRFRKGDPRWEAIDQSLTEINQILTEAGIPFLLVYQPMGKESRKALLHEVGEREGFPVHPITLWEDPRWSDKRPLDYVNSASDSHCNPKGCEVWSTLLYEIMEKENFLQLRAEDSKSALDSSK